MHIDDLVKLREKLIMDYDVDDPKNKTGAELFFKNTFREENLRIFSDDEFAKIMALCRSIHMLNTVLNEVFNIFKDFSDQKDQKIKELEEKLNAK